MNKSIKFLAISIILIFLTIGAVSASDDVDEQSISQIDNTAPQVIQNTQTANIVVNYQYSDDKAIITPEIIVKNNDIILNSTKTYNTGLYSVKIQTPSSNGLDITVSSPGYESQTKTNVDLSGTLVFDLKATESYKLGRDITAIADNLLNFKSADRVLAITTAGVPKYNGKTSEYAIDGILNYANGLISYGQGNILMLRQTAIDPVDFCFVIQKGNDLQAVIFNNASYNYAYFGTISEAMSHAQWNDLCKAVGSTDAFSYASLANAWKDNITYLVLQEAAFHGHVCEGTLGGYTITQAILNDYPPVQETSLDGGSPGDISSYKLLGVPGDSLNDAVLFYLDSTAGKKSYTGFNTTSTGANTTMLAVIRWEDSVTSYNAATNAYEVTKPGKGTLALIQYNAESNKKLFQKETGITDEGSLEEIIYNSWWINKIKTNPSSLISYVYELDGISEEDLYYFIGSADPITFPTAVINATNAGSVRFEASTAHGLDFEYIQNLSKKLPTSTRVNTTSTTGTLSYNQIKNIGTTASNMAKNEFAKVGINLDKDMQNFAVMTSAGYVLLNGQSTEAAWDGLYELFGSRLSRQTLLPDHNGIWKPLWFTFVLNQKNGTLLAVYVRYNPDGTYYMASYENNTVMDIGWNTINSSKAYNDMNGKVFVDGNWFSIQSILNAWTHEPAFDQLLSFLFHNHACPGVQPGFIMTEYIHENYPLSENESYFYIASSIYCKDDSLEYILGVSPGMGTYMVQRLPDSFVEDEEYLKDGTKEGVLVVWDEANNVGKAVIMNFKWPVVDTSGGSTSEAKRAMQIAAFVDIYKGNPNPNVKELPEVLGSEERYITAEQFNVIKSGGTDDLNIMSFIKSLPNLSKEQVIAQQAQQNQQNQENASNANQQTNNGGSSSNSNKNTNSNTNAHKHSSTSKSKANVGVTSNVKSSTAKNTVTSDESQDESQDSEGGDSSNGNTYEITESSPSSQSNNNAVAYTAAGLIAILALAGIGYFRFKK